MLLSGQTGYEARVKEHMMIEFSTIDRLDAQPSPRIFNTHLPFSMLPVDAMRQKQIKVTGAGGRCPVMDVGRGQEGSGGRDLVRDGLRGPGWDMIERPERDRWEGPWKEQVGGAS